MTKCCTLTGKFNVQEKSNEGTAIVWGEIRAKEIIKLNAKQSLLSSDCGRTGNHLLYYSHIIQKSSLD